MTVEIKTGENAYGPFTSLIVTVGEMTRAASWTGGTHPALVEQAIRSVAGPLGLDAGATEELRAQVRNLLA